MPEDNPKCDGSKDACRHPWSFHRKKQGTKCGAMGCKCKGFVGDPPVVEVTEKAASA